MNRQNTDPCEAGMQLIEVSEILAKKFLSDADLQQIQLTGTDSRYYLLVRGLLLQQLQFLEDRIYRSSQPPDQALHQQKLQLLKALRLIDLE